MNKFAVPQPGQVITVSTYYKSNVIGRTEADDTTTYEHVPVLPPQSWTPSGAFCIPAEGEPFISFRTISIERVTALEVHEGEEASTDIKVGTHYVPVAGSNDKIYSVVVVDGVAKSCDCLGFTYRGQCRHLRIATGEHPVNPRRETIKKQKRKAAVAKRRPPNGAPTKADAVRDIIRGRKLAMKRSTPDVDEQVRQWCITDAIERIGMSRSLATTYVKNNWSKV